MPASPDAHTCGHGLVSKVRGYLAAGTAHRWEGGREGRKRSSMGRLARRWPPDTAWLPVARGVHEALVRPPLGVEGV
jgi:hypothetical protein